MRRSVRSLGFVALVIFAISALGWSSTMTAVVQLLATTAFIMGGTQHPLADPDNFDPPPLGNHSLSEPAFATDYVNAATTKYIVPTAALRGDDPGSHINRVATYTPEEFWPIYGTRTFNDSVAVGVQNLDTCIQGTPCTAHIFVTEDGAPATTYVVFGYSQSARVATIEKRNLIAQYRNPDGSWDPIEDSHGVPIEVSFVLIGNPNRPNGGILERFNGLSIPILDVTFDGATPTDSCEGSGASQVCHFPTVDISRQYDGWSDFPAYPLNLLADVNALAGIAYLHGGYLSAAVPPMEYQGTTGDTTYYLIPTGHLPILMPLEQIGVPSPLISALDAPLRVMVEWGYDRDTSPGAPIGAGLLRIANPITDLTNLAVAIPTGWDDGISEAAGDPNLRPFQTHKPDSPYGVGGNALPDPPASDVESMRISRSSAEPVANDVDTAVEPNATKTPKAKKGPLRQLLRGPIGTEAKQPAAIRHSGEQPLKKIVEALTGLKPKLHKGGDTEKPAGDADDAGGKAQPAA